METKRGEGETRFGRSSPMRATVEQALERVQEYITALEDESVPTSLLRERVKAIRAWGVGVEARGSSGGGSKSQQIRNIQEKLDKMKDSEMYVRAQRATCPWYPYESEEQQRMALVCEKHTNQQGTEDLFKSLHGGKGKRSLLAADLQSPENKRLLSARSIEECSKKMPRYECALREQRTRELPLPNQRRLKHRDFVCAASSGTRRC